MFDAIWWHVYCSSCWLWHYIWQLQNNRDHFLQLISYFGFRVLLSFHASVCQWDDAQYHAHGVTLDWYINWLWLAIFVRFTVLRNFQWYNWTRSEGWWLILGNVRNSHCGLRFGGMQCTMARITGVCEMASFNQCSHFLISAGRGCCRSHDDVSKWKHFPRYWPFVRGIHRSPHKGQWRGALMFT